jgi:hypothetical protein
VPAHDPRSSFRTGHMAVARIVGSITTIGCRSFLTLLRTTRASRLPITTRSPISTVGAKVRQRRRSAAC